MSAVGPAGDVVLATDGLSLIATAGFFVPAAALVVAVVAAVVRDRRLSAREQAEHERAGHDRAGHERVDGTPRRVD